MRKRVKVGALCALGLTSWGGATLAANLDSRFTYQGQFQDNGVPVDDPVDVRFNLWDGPGAGCPPAGGSQVGVNHSLLNVTVERGLFKVEVNTGGEFGPTAFNGERRWLQVAVRHPAGVGGYTVLCPRQEITAAPYAQFAVHGPFWSLTGNAGTNPATDFVGTSDDQPLQLRTGGGLQVVAPAGNAGVALPASSISAAEILDEPAIANDDYSDDNINLGDPVQTLLSRSITVPAAGYVLVLGTAQVIFTHVNGTQSWAEFAVSNTNVGPISSHDIGVVIPAASIAGEYAFGVTPHRVFSVAAGTHTYYLLADELFGNWRVNDLQLTLIYFPTALSFNAAVGAVVEGDIEASSAAPVPPAEGQSQPTVEQLLAELATLQRRVAALEAGAKESRQDEQKGGTR